LEEYNKYEPTEEAADVEDEAEPEVEF